MASSSNLKSGSSDSERLPQASGSFESEGYESRTLGSIRREREREMRRARVSERTALGRKRSRMPFLVLGIVAAVALVSLIVYITLINTDYFDIREVRFEGVEHLTEEEVDALVNIPQGTTLLNVDTASIVASLGRDAWVKDVDVRLEFPDKLVIDVIERDIGAVAEVPIGANQVIQNWAISDDGIWLMAIPSRDSEIGSHISEHIYEDAEAALHINGIPYGVEPSIGAQCTDDSIVNALEIVTGMTTELASQVKTVTATDAESTLLTLDNNIEIAFGDNSNIREKERICLKIMEENPTVVYINVRVPDRPTWRSA